MKTGGAALGVLLAGYCVGAAAYSDTTAFSADPSADTVGGGGQIYFTGSPRQHGLDCAVCHIGGPEGVVGVRLTSLRDDAPAPLFDEGYQPGALYEIEVALDEDRLMPTAGCADAEFEPCDINLFALEILDGAYKPAGALCPTRPNLDGAAEGCAGCTNQRSGGVLVASDCSVALADAFDATAFSWRNGTIAYSFFWRAPDSDVGLLTAYVSAVDGRGQETSDGEVTSFTNDGVVTVQVPIASPSEDATPPLLSSCASAPAGPGGALGLLVALLARGRRRRGVRGRPRVGAFGPGQ